MRCIVFYIYDAHLFSLAEIVDPTSGRFYYRNVNDGSTTWEKPAGFDEAKAASQANAEPLDEQKEVPVLSEAVNQTGQEADGTSAILTTGNADQFNSVGNEELPMEEKGDDDADDGAQNKSDEAEKVPSHDDPLDDNDDESPTGFVTL